MGVPCVCACLTSVAALMLLPVRPSAQNAKLHAIHGLSCNSSLPPPKKLRTRTRRIDLGRVGSCVDNACSLARRFARPRGIVIDFHGLTPTAIECRRLAAGGGEKCRGTRVEGREPSKALLGKLL